MFWNSTTYFSFMICASVTGPVTGVSVIAECHAVAVPQAARSLFSVSSAAWVFPALNNASALLSRFSLYVTSGWLYAASRRLLLTVPIADVSAWPGVAPTIVG